MSNEKFGQFLYNWSVHLKNDGNHDLRVGQAAYNAYAELWPEAARELNGGEADPFHDDRRLPGFLARVLRTLDEPD